MTNHKDCLLCKHCYLSNATPGYSEYTPSSPMSFECLKRHWDFDEYSHGKGALVTILKMAQTCADFELDDLPETKICPVCFKICHADQKGITHDYCSKKCERHGKKKEKQ